MVLFIQFGDYRETAERFAGGGDETYHSQRYSDDLIAGLVDSHGGAGVICVNSEPYEETLKSGVHTVGMPLYRGATDRDLVALLKRLKPSRLVPRSPILAALNWARRQGVPALPMLADSFQEAGLRAQLGRWRLKRALNDAHFQWVGNHNVNASRDLERIGVGAAKIVPWDWPSSLTPEDFEAKQSPAGPPFRVAYVGAVTKAKGVGDLLQAVARLRESGMEVVASIVGSGAGQDELKRMAQGLSLGEAVRFLGRVPHSEVLTQMAAHDAVVVPSRHEYAEGLPMTIYDALVSRTPLVASDHPMFVGKVTHGESALVFPAGDAGALAGALERLGSDNDIYGRLSENSAAAWESLQCPVKWGDLLMAWLNDTPEDRRFLESHSLANYDYP